MDEKDIKIKPRCLTFPMENEYHTPAAYTADGFMLPCCWLDQPEVDDDVEKVWHLKDNHLAVKNVNKLEEIYGSKEWENFFDALINRPSKAMNYCQYKCGNVKWKQKI